MEVECPVEDEVVPREAVAIEEKVGKEVEVLLE